MFQQLLQRLQHCNQVSARIGHASHTELQQLKEQLSEQMGKPIGWHTMGLPAAISTLGIILSFAIPQLWLGYIVMTGLNLPPQQVFIWVVFTSLIFAAANAVTMFTIGKGSITAVKMHLALSAISLMLASAYLICSLVAEVTSSYWAGSSVAAAITGSVMWLISAGCIRSTAFYQMLLFALHNRVWRQSMQVSRRH